MSLGEKDLGFVAKNPYQIFVALCLEALFNVNLENLLDNLYDLCGKLTVDL